MTDDASEPGAGPLPFVRERDVDLLLAESFSSDAHFRRWFLAEVPDMGKSLETEVLKVRVSDLREGAPAEAVGETDVRVDIEWTDGVTGLLSIENKIAAEAQPAQGRRHQVFVKSEAAVVKASVLVAPESWINSHAVEVAEYDMAVSMEAIAQHHLDRNDESVTWRGRVFAQAAAQRPVSVPAPDLDEWCVDLAGMIGEYGLRLAPQFRERTPVAGRSKPDRFIWCADETLTALGGLWPSLYFKTATARRPGRVSIDVSIRPSDLRRSLLECSAAAHGLSVGGTEATLIVEVCPPESAALTPTLSVAEQSDAVHALAQAGCRLQTWWNGLTSEDLVE